MIDPEMGKGEMLDGELCVIALPKRQLPGLDPCGFQSEVNPPFGRFAFTCLVPVGLLSVSLS